MEVRVVIPIMCVLIKCAGLGQGTTFTVKNLKRVSPITGETRLSFLL